MERGSRFYLRFSNTLHINFPRLLITLFSTRKHKTFRLYIYGNRNLIDSKQIYQTDTLRTYPETSTVIHNNRINYLRLFFCSYRQITNKGGQNMRRLCNMVRYAFIIVLNVFIMLVFHSYVNLILLDPETSTVIHNNRINYLRLFFCSYRQIQIMNSFFLIKLISHF